MTIAARLGTHRNALLTCTRCSGMVGPPIAGQPVRSQVLLVGQAPGDREGALGRPFAWTAGKTLFKWFESIGLDEAAVRERIYMAAVCRCFPGKNPRGGDRVPSEQEIGTCARWLDAEIEMLAPRLLLPVGKLAISQFMDVPRLSDVVGQCARVVRNGHEMDAIALPHPSGASTWHRKEPGISLLDRALALVRQHPAWRAACTGTTARARA